MVPFLEDNVIYRGVYCWLGGNEGNAQWCGRDGLLPGGYWKMRNSGKTC